MSDSARKIQGVFLLVFVNVMWGLSFIFSKTALSEGLPSMTLAFLRYAMTVAMLIPLCLKKEGGIRLGKWAGLGFMTTMLGITVYYFFEYEGLKRTSASAASLILALVPMMTLLYRVIFTHERISLMRWLCVAASLLGVFLVISADTGDGPGSLMGNLLMVAACLCWTGYIIISPRLLNNCSSLRVTTWQAICGLVSLLPLALAERGSWVPLSAKAWGCIFMLAAICSALCYVLYGIAIRHVDSLTVSLSININPIAACVAGGLLLGETLTGMQLFGGVIIMIAVLLDSLESTGALSALKIRA